MTTASGKGNTTELFSSIKPPIYNLKTYNYEKEFVYVVDACGSRYDNVM